MPQLRHCAQGSDWQGLIQGAAQGLLQLNGRPSRVRPALAGLFLSNLELACRRYRRGRTAGLADPLARPQVVVVGSELSHNAAGRAHGCSRISSWSVRQREIQSLTGV